MWRNIVHICMDKDRKTIILSELFNDKLVQKKFFGDIANWILNSKIQSSKILGNQLQLEVVKNAILESKNFHDELFNPNTTIDLINLKMNSKNLAIKKFENLFKVKWLFWLFGII